MHPETTTVSPVRHVRPPAVPLKAWKIDRAAELGITVKALEQRIYRGRHPWPNTVRLGYNRIDVIL